MPPPMPSHSATLSVFVQSSPSEEHKERQWRIEISHCAASGSETRNCPCTIMHHHRHWDPDKLDVESRKRVDWMETTKDRSASLRVTQRKAQHRFLAEVYSDLFFSLGSDSPNRMAAEHSADMFKLLEKQGELLMESYRSMSHELHKLQVEEEMLMQKLYKIMTMEGLLNKAVAIMIAPTTIILEFLHQYIKLLPKLSSILQITSQQNLKDIRSISSIFNILLALEQLQSPFQEKQGTNDSNVDANKSLQ
ncbi:hypothetical protein ZIOFF_055051 [Zingiber officinale]|uniref:Uncharacterized protein n=1 Tax=Zingiber officinale TaxID=94328 RepID=A0A8J5FGV7_ZINOF|nr:hypothetical protein ZIOFF_055051 [Zingiber officinale]